MALFAACVGGSPTFLDSNVTVSDPTAIGSPSNVTIPVMPINGSIGGILFCQDLNWVNCTYTVQPLNTCIVTDLVWNKAISSIGPDNGTVLIVYNDTDCEGNSTAFVYPGNSDLTTIGWNDQISSLKALEI
ncbi:hypothetical protein K439DRAFT_1632974 [Ramaria rubella]|nr:hypothetical protein K439DRAFT_1632974 [Ramaria rubella]